MSTKLARPVGRPPMEESEVKRNRVFRVSDKEIRNWQKKAKRAGLPLAAWLREVCNEAT